MPTIMLVLSLALGAWQAKPTVLLAPQSTQGDGKSKASQHIADTCKEKNTDKSPTIEDADRIGFVKEHPCSENEAFHPKNKYWDFLYHAYLVATIVGVIGGFFGLYFIWQQVKATQASAEAASKNAVALMDAERAWITVDVRGGSGESGVELVIRNCGRTPAFISAVKGVVVGSIQELPTEPPDGSFVVKQTILAPNDSFSVALEELLTPMIFRDFLVIGGVVRYTSVFKIEKEWLGLPPYTRFCYSGKRTKDGFVFARVWNEFYSSYS